ncbi:thiamine biosynthesis protein [Actinobacillus equuli]|nr:thiamine biosynthesis protein [Actinobacillus equuli]
MRKYANFINNQPLDVAENTSIQTALALSQTNLQGVAVALNQQIVPKTNGKIICCKREQNLPFLRR